MDTLTPLTTATATGLLPEWELALTAENKSTLTIKVYLGAARQYLTWTGAQGSTPLELATLNQWVADALASGRSGATARTRQLAVRRFAAWLLATGRLRDDPFRGVKTPKVDPLVVSGQACALSACLAGPTSATRRLQRSRRGELAQALQPVAALDELRPPVPGRRATGGCHRLPEPHRRHAAVVLHHAERLLVLDGAVDQAVDTIGEELAVPVQHVVAPGTTCSPRRKPPLTPTPNSVHRRRIPLRELIIPRP